MAPTKLLASGPSLQYATEDKVVEVRGQPIGASPQKICMLLRYHHGDTTESGRVKIWFKLHGILGKHSISKDCFGQKHKKNFLRYKTRIIVRCDKYCLQWTLCHIGKSLRFPRRFGYSGDHHWLRPLTCVCRSLETRCLYCRLRERFVWYSFTVTVTVPRRGEGIFVVSMVTVAMTTILGLPCVFFCTLNDIVMKI